MENRGKRAGGLIVIGVLLMAIVVMLGDLCRYYRVVNEASTAYAGLVEKFLEHRGA